MHVEKYEEMKQTFLNLTSPESKLWLSTTNPIFSIVYDIYENTIWAGWRPKDNNLSPDFVDFELTESEAKNFNKKIYDKAINTLLLKFKQKQIEQKIKQINKDFK